MNIEIRKEKKIGKEMKLTRRGVLGTMAAAAGTIASLLFIRPSVGIPTVVEAVNTQKGFSLATRTSDGVTIDALAEPGRLAFTVKGTFESKMLIPLVAYPGGSQELSEEQEQAVLQLLSASGSFVRPWDVELRYRRNAGTIYVRFMFTGEEDPARRIRLTLRLENAYGSSETIIQECVDQRIIVKETPECIAVRRVTFLDFNAERFDFDVTLLGRIEQISVVLEEL